jgi:type II secretory pathway pseudopilin PulG
MRRVTTVRRGATLVEMLVALTLSALVGAAVATALAAAERYMRVARAASVARRTLREAQAVLASELRAASADSLRVRGDTAVDFLGLVGLSVVCVSSGTVLVLPPEVAADGLPYTSWRASPESGDLVVAFDTASGGAWRPAVVDTAVARTDGAGCRPSSGLLSAADSAARKPVTRLQLRAPLDPSIAVGAPVRVLRSGRYALTHSGDGNWVLSYRRCAGSSCGTAQPVAGPLSAPTDSGLFFTSVAGESRVEAALRAPGSGQHAPRDGTVLRLTVRNDATGKP